MSDLVTALLCWLLIQLMGSVALPLAFRLFRWLPDRGYAFAKAMGVLLICYLFWLLNSLGYVRNTAGGILLSAAAVAAFSVWVYRRGGTSAQEVEGLRGWLRRNRRYVMTTELLFGVAFGLWAVVRAYSPEIIGTEKPMDLAFMNAVSRSEQFPPLDPWLSGYAISYYYFGYVIISTLARLANVSGSIAFNVGQAWLFAGTLLGGYGLVINLVQGGRRDEATLDRSVGAGLLGGLMVGVMGNLEGLLEVLRVKAALPAAFWQWLDIKDINSPPLQPGVWPPRSGWWWWRASRVIHDKDLLGNDLEVINEFPFFSFLLGDMHPHVLALPFVFLALALALNWWLKQWQPNAGSDGSIGEWLCEFLREADPVHLGVYAVCLGALGFLNTWDFPIYLFVAVGALMLAHLRSGSRLRSGYVVEAWVAGLATLGSLVIFVRRREMDGGLSWLMLALLLFAMTIVLGSLARNRRQQSGRFVPGLIGQMLLVGVALLAGGVILYLPFYLGFRSQAGGLLPNVINPSRLSQYLVMFGAFLLLLIPWMISVARRASFPFKTFLAVAAGIWGALLLAWGSFAAVALSSPLATGWVERAVQQLGSIGAAVQRVATLRLMHSWTSLLLVVLIGMVVALWRSRFRADAEPAEGGSSAGLPFVLLLILTAALLTLVPEFVYLKDNFGTRMNTIFKFYYQAWVMLAMAGAYAVWAMWDRGGRTRWLAGVGGLLVIAAGMVYPALSIPTRTNHFSGQPTLDGRLYMAASQPADYAMITWLQENVDGAPVILEAVGGQYSSGGRVSVHTGLPTVLGWAGHELQWRGATAEPAIRESDVDTMYRSLLWPETQLLLDKYHVEYVIVGSLEINTYGPAVATKFDRVLELVYDTAGAKIYRWNHPN